MNMPEFTLGCFVLALACATPLSAHASDFDVTTPQSNIAIAPGGYADVPLTFTNTTASDSPELILRIPALPSAGYTYVQRSQSPECGPMENSPELAGWSQFRLMPLPTGGQRTCVIRVMRDASAIDNHDTNWFLSQGNGSVHLRIGSFVNVALSAQRVSATVDAAGVAHSVFRLSAHNAGPIGIGKPAVSLGPVCTGATVEVDTNLTGGCEAAEIPCGFVGGPGPAANLPPVASGATQSCLVRLSAQRSLDGEVHALLIDSLTNAATGGWVMDSDGNDNRVDLTVNGSNASMTVAAPTASPWALALMAMLLLAATTIVPYTRR